MRPAGRLSWPDSFATLPRMLAFIPFAALLTVSQSPVSWSFSSSWMEDGRVDVMIEASVQDGWHFYATELPSDEGPIATAFRFKQSDSFEVVSALTEPVPEEEFDENFGVMVRHHSGKPRFHLVVRPLGKGPFEVQGEVEYMACNNNTCLPPVVVPFIITVPAS